MKMEYFHCFGTVMTSLFSRSTFYLRDAGLMHHRLLSA